MNMQKPKKIRKEMRDRLHRLYAQGYGVAKKPLKKGAWSPYIHSQATYDTYIQQANRFADWCMEQGYRIRDEYVTDMVRLYLLDMEQAGKSPYTLSTALNAICKALGLRTSDIEYTLPKKERANIKRSRQSVERDKHINPAHYEFLYTFQRCFGLRRAKELEKIRAEDFVITDDAIFCTVNGKGGKTRQVRAYGEKEELTVIRHHLQANRTGLVFPPGTIPSGFDAHALRAEYAARVYHAHARATIPPSDRYICRGDKKGEIYDKKAIEIVSKMLGHNRLNVVIDHYSYRF